MLAWRIVDIGFYGVSNDVATNFYSVTSLIDVSLNE